MTTSLTEKKLLQRSAAGRFVLGLALLVAPGFIAGQLALAFPERTAAILTAVLVCRILGAAVLGLSLADLAESKGQSRLYGFLVLLGIFGLLWAVLLRDRNREEAPSFRTYTW